LTNLRHNLRSVCHEILIFGEAGIEAGIAWMLAFDDMGAIAPMSSKKAPHKSASKTIHDLASNSED